MAIRIIGGTSRGLHLTPVGDGDAKAHLRPTSDRVREAIFNLLINGGYGNPVAGARVLDLFAGTGALGLEALSRGAATATFVDDGVVAVGLIKRNVGLMRAEDRTQVIKRDATRLAAYSGAPHSLVFLDPPYGKGLGAVALTEARAQGWLAPDALVVWEENEAPKLPPGFDMADQRRYGDTVVRFLKAQA
jgi:16S rRNA (guanine966-N2)-methyltransferase